MSRMKFRLTNRYLYGSYFVLILFLFVSWLFASGFIEILTLDYNAPDLVPGYKDEIQQVYLYQISTWERLVDSSMYYLINLMPIAIVLPTMAFFEEKRMLLLFAKQRVSSITKELFKASVVYALLSALYTALAFTTFYSIGGLFVRRGLEDIGGFASIFPPNFYQEHPYLFFLFMVWSIYFLSSLCLSLLSCGLILILDKKYQVLLVILVIAFTTTFLKNITTLKIFDVYAMFLAFNTLDETLEMFLPLLLLIGLIIPVFWFGLNRVKKNY